MWVRYSNITIVTIAWKVNRLTRGRAGTWPDRSIPLMAVASNTSLIVFGASSEVLCWPVCFSVSKCVNGSVLEAATLVWADFKPQLLSVTCSLSRCAATGWAAVRLRWWKHCSLVWLYLWILWWYDNYRDYVYRMIPFILACYAVCMLASNLLFLIIFTPKLGHIRKQPKLYQWRILRWCNINYSIWRLTVPSILKPLQFKKPLLRITTNKLRAYYGCEKHNFFIIPAYIGLSGPLSENTIMHKFLCI